MRILDYIKRILLRAKGYNSKGNDGFIPRVPTKKDWVFGAIGEVLNESGDWTPYLPTDERQRKYGLETMSCVTFSACNVIETLMNYKLAHNLISEDNKKWLQDNGYIVDSKLNFSDRFIALLSFTSSNGNTGNRVFGAIKNNGLIPESMFPWNPEDDTWGEYHDRSKITDEMKDLGSQFKQRFPIRYYVVYKQDFDIALKESPLQVYVDGYYRIRNGVLQFSDRMSNHAAMKQELYSIYDSYSPFEKGVVSDYPYWSGLNMLTGKRHSYGYKVKITENIIKKKMIKTIKQKSQPEIYAIDLEAGTINSFGGWESYKKFLDAEWCEPFLEVDEKYTYLRRQYSKGFVKGSRVGMIK